MSENEPPQSPDSVSKSDEGDIQDSTSESSYTSSEIITRFAQSLGENVNNVGKESEDIPSKIKPKGARKKRAKIPNIRIFYGDFVHTPSRGTFVILSKWLLGVEDGKIVFSEPVSRYREILRERNLKHFARNITISLGEGTFMIPGFVDLHTDAVSFLATGVQECSTCDQLPTSDRHREKLQLIHDDRLANQLFSKVIDWTICCGSTTVAYDGTHIESACRLLANTLAQHKQRGYVSVDMCVPHKRESDAMIQLTKAHDVINHIYQMKHATHLQVQLLLSAPLPDWLEKRVIDIQKEKDITIKVSLSDSEATSLITLEKETPLQYHTKHGLIHDKTIALHSPDLNFDDLTNLQKVGASLVFCPAADIKNCQYTNLKLLLSTDIKLGLGTDLKNSGSLSMLHAIRQCVQVVQQQEIKKPDEKEEVGEVPVTEAFEKEVDYRDFFYMATLGGAEVLGISDKVGSFEVGKEFDAVLVDPHVHATPFFSVLGKDTCQDLVERFLFSGDDRNITAVYISGQRVK